MTTKDHGSDRTQDFAAAAGEPAHLRAVAAADDSSAGGQAVSPPPGITAGKVTSGSQCTKLDWLRFTLPPKLKSHIVKLLRAKLGIYEATVAGGRTRRELRHQWSGGGVVAFDHTEDTPADVYVDLPGAILAEWTPDEQLDLIRWVFKVGGKVTRLDLAIDWYGGPAEWVIEALRTAAAAGEVTGFRKFSVINERKVGGARTGHQITFGSRGRNGSGKLVRVYDKGLETEDAGEGHWVRYEAELTGDRATAAAGIITKGHAGVEPGSDLDYRRLTQGVAYSLLDVREVTGGKNRSLERRPRLLWWQRIIDGVELLPVTVPRERRGGHGHIAHLIEVCLPKVRRLLVGMGVDFETLCDEVVRNELLVDDNDGLDHARREAFVLLGTDPDEADARIREYVYRFRKGAA